VRIDNSYRGLGSLSDEVNKTSMIVYDRSRFYLLDIHSVRLLLLL
jgi:hypothetical protein